MFGTRQQRVQLEEQFGCQPQETYDDEDFRMIRAYYDQRRAREPHAYTLDETTWYDLSMDTVFERISRTGSASGEQVLYDQLRRPALDQDEYERRRRLIGLMEETPDLRLRLQRILSRLGKSRAARTTEAFSPGKYGRGRLLLNLLLLTALLVSGGCLIFTRLTLPLFIALLVGNPIYHIAMLKRLDYHLPAANYTVGLAAAYRACQRLDNADLAEWLRPYEKAGRRARRLALLGGVSFAANNEFAQIVNSFVLIDLILYELLKVRLSWLRAEVFRLHECIGRIDAAIAVASYRRSLAAYCDPVIDFRDGEASMAAVDLVHPLLRHPVANTLMLRDSLLLTGSNASGKSTLIKAAALNAVLAQGICTAVCTLYEATAFHVYTSMALSDDILNGESYFVTELKAFRRILAAAQRGERVLCAIDEVLRETNTVERIAASSVLLEHVASLHTICIAASHDIELCTLLNRTFSMAHFEEAVVEGAVRFDYRLRQGPACTRNAIRLLGSMGFDDRLVAAAEERAEAYLEAGRWQSP